MPIDKPEWLREREGNVRFEDLLAKARALENSIQGLIKEAEILSVSYDGHYTLDSSVSAKVLSGEILPVVVPEIGPAADFTTSMQRLGCTLSEARELLRIRLDSIEQLLDLMRDWRALGWDLIHDVKDHYALEGRDGPRKVALPHDPFRGLKLGEAAELLRRHQPRGGENGGA